jgi:hypothetical protein
MHGHEGEYTQEFTASNDIVFQVGAHFVPVGDTFKNGPPCAR